MGFLIDINQIDRTGIDYALNLFDDTVISSTGGFITGNLTVANTGLLNVFGDICTESGVIFDCENRRIGVGAVPQCSVHIKDLYLNNQNAENEAVVELLTYGQNMSGVIKSDNLGNLNIEGSTEILFRGAGGNNLLAASDGSISGGAVIFDGNMEISGFEAISRTKAATIKTFKNDNTVRQQYYDCVTRAGEMSWLVSKSIGDTGYSLNTGIYDIQGSGYIPTLENDGENLSAGIRSQTYGIYSAGKLIENTQNVKKQYFVTGENLCVLRLESAIESLYDFDYGNQFWIYIKTIGEYQPVDASLVFPDLPAGIARSSNSSTVKWKLTQLFNNETEIRYDFQVEQTNELKLRRAVAFQENNFGKNSIHLLGVMRLPQQVGLVVPLNLLYKYENLSLKNESITNFTTLAMEEGGYSDLNTEILMQSGCLYEIGLVRRPISNDEVDKIINNGNLLDSMPNTGEIGFLFKINAGSGNTVYDVVNGYTGTIINFNEDYWS